MLTSLDTQLPAPLHTQLPACSTAYCLILTASDIPVAWTWHLWLTVMASRNISCNKTTPLSTFLLLPPVSYLSYLVKLITVFLNRLILSLITLLLCHLVMIRIFRIHFILITQLLSHLILITLLLSHLILITLLLCHFIVIWYWSHILVTWYWSHYFLV